MPARKDSLPLWPRTTSPAKGLFHSVENKPCSIITRVLYSLHRLNMPITQKEYVMKKLIIIAALSALLTGCASVGDHVGGPDRCMVETSGICAQRVVDGVIVAGSTVDMYNDGTVLADVPVKQSGLRHMYDGVEYNGGSMIIGRSHNPTAKPMLN